MFRYRGIGCVLLGLFAFTIAAAAQSDDKPSGPSKADMQEMRNYALAMDKVQRMSAAIKALAPLQEQHPEFNPTDSSKNIDEMVQKFEKYPGAVAVLRNNGFSTRDFVDCLVTTVQATVDVAYKRENKLKDYSPDALQEVGKANLDFMEQHWDEVQKLTGNADD